MKFLINIGSDSELICYEALALAMTLATFDHQVQLNFMNDSLIVLQNENSRLFGMVQSLELYDMPLAYHQFSNAVDTLDKKIQAVLTADTTIISDYDTVLNF
ncbi:hypothetical protein NKT77_03395 [Moraxella sp. FZLJ2107]|uniref:hypothetical protein n=1 Tax=unclassified Moraxella TaxID=2685852 RepID=UPI0020C85608|nr:MULTISPECIES: hypothetical protein [unclassified Moraxella]UTO05710.1 hypothetical protein NKT77_03395 [Moraxella sp. FZLJ2107]UTO22446.1 hypothetical protein NKU06_00175 [Moraxella sp. FZLJ2109]